MKLNEAGLDFIKSFESLRLEAYPDPASDLAKYNASPQTWISAGKSIDNLSGTPWTIGYGHTKGVNEGDICTEDQANQWLQEDCQWACDAVCNALTLELNDNQFSALVSFTFNCGAHNLQNSELLKEINDCNFNHITINFEAYDHAGGQVVGGLLRRRNAEAQLFLTADNS